MSRHARRLRIVDPPTRFRRTTGVTRRPECAAAQRSFSDTSPPAGCRLEPDVSTRQRVCAQSVARRGRRPGSWRNPRILTVNVLNRPDFRTSTVPRLSDVCA